MPQFKDVAPQLGEPAYSFTERLKAELLKSAMAKNGSDKAKVFDGVEGKQALMATRIRQLVSDQTCLGETQMKGVVAAIKTYTAGVRPESRPAPGDAIDEALRIATLIESSRFTCNKCLNDKCDGRTNTLEEVLRRVTLQPAPVKKK